MEKEKIEPFAKERIQQRLEEEVKDMTWDERAKHLSKVASIYLAELSNHYDSPMEEEQYLKHNPDTTEEI